MGSHVALVKWNRQMGFQVDRATHIFFSFGLMRSPDGISYWFWLKGIAGWDLRLAQPHRILVLVKGDCRTGSQVSPTAHRILVLVKGDRRTGSQVSPTAHRILVLVKGDRRTGSQVNPTTQILVLVQGDRPMGSQDKTEKKKRFSLQSLLCETLRSFAS